MGSQHSPAPSARRQRETDFRSDRQTRDEEYLDDPSYSHSYRLQELWGGPTRHED
jgi:hypothetical protein